MTGKVDSGIVEVMTSKVKENFMQEVTCNIRTKRFIRSRQAKVEEWGGKYDSSRGNVMWKH